MGIWFYISPEKGVHTLKQTRLKSRLAACCCDLFALVISGVSTIGGLTAINRYNASTTQATDLYIMALDAEKAHFSWVENLSSAINFDTEFTGGMDYTSCSLRELAVQYRYGDNSGCPDHNMIEEIKPIHQSIHDSAETILEMNKPATLRLHPKCFKRDKG